MAKRQTGAQDGRTTIGDEVQVRQFTDALCGSMHSAAYKHAVLGLIFLKYIFVVMLLFEMLEPYGGRVHYLPSAGVAGLALANDSMSSRGARAVR